MSCDNCSSLLPLDQRYHCLCSGKSCKEGFSTDTIKNIQKAMRKKCSEDHSLQGSGRYFKCSECPQYNDCKKENDIRFFNMTNDEISKIKKQNVFNDAMYQLNAGNELCFPQCYLKKDKNKYKLILRRGDIEACICLNNECVAIAMPD